MSILYAQTQEGKSLPYESDIKASGGMKEVYFAPNREYALAFYKTPPSSNALDRLNQIINIYRTAIFKGKGWNYWESLFCFPQAIVKDAYGKIGIQLPFYPAEFFFKEGNQQGLEKRGSWFTSPVTHQLLHPREKGNLKSMLEISLQLSRAVRRLHNAGLAHGDLSFNNVLVNPQRGTVLLADTDALVVPHKYPSEVLGTPEIMAPELYQTMNLPSDNSLKRMPSIQTDLHALAVLVYMYLFKRHPLKGKKVFDADPQMDNLLSMGERALFIEHPTNASNRPAITDKLKPWCNIKKLPYLVLGNSLGQLFEQSFIKGLHQAERRPIAAAWEAALLDTLDKWVPCSNPKCEQQGFIWNEQQRKPRCPYCGQRLKKAFPFLKLYKMSRKSKKFLATHRYLAGHHMKQLFFKDVFCYAPSVELLSPSQRKPLAYLQLKRNKWYLCNLHLKGLYLLNKNERIQIHPNQGIQLSNGMQLLLGDPTESYIATIHFVKTR